MGSDSGDRGAEAAAATGGALRRMVRRAPPVRRAASDAGGLRAALPRAMDRIAGLAVSLGAHGLEALGRDDLGALLPGGALVFRLSPEALPTGDEPDRAQDGIAWLGADLFAAIVERRLTGRLRGAPAVRPPTPLDAVICGELIDALCTAPGVTGDAAMRAAGHLADPDLPVVLADLPFRVLRLAVRLPQGGERGGEIGFALPDPPPPPEVEPPPGAPRADLLACRVDLEALLPPVVLSWARITHLAPGERIALDEGAIDAVRVEAAGGALVSVGRLGRMGEARAVRLRAAPPAAGRGAALSAAAGTALAPAAALGDREADAQR